MPQSSNDPLRVTVVAGPWGAGKTGVVNRLAGALADGSVVLCDGLNEGRHRHSGVEVVHVEHEIVYASRGCPCCAVRADLVEAVDDLLARRRRPRHVLIEAVAGSDVPVIAQTFLRSSRLRAQVVVAGLVAVVDGHAVATAMRVSPSEVPRSLDLDAVAMADLVVINRLERLVPEVEQRTAWEIWSRNAAGQVHVDLPTDGRDPLPDRVLGLAGFRLAPQSSPPRSKLSPSLMPPTAAWHHERTLADGERPLRHVLIDLPGRLDRDGLDDWVGDLQGSAGSDLLRWRGDFSLAGESRRWLGHGVRTTVVVDDGPRVEDEPSSRIEVIGRVPPGADLAASLSERLE